MTRKILLVCCLAVAGTGFCIRAGAETDIDPFTGQTLAIEQTRAVLELTKEQNALLEEQTKKAKAEFMLKNADKIFAAELRKQLDQSGGMGGRSSGGYPATRFPEPEQEGKKTAGSHPATTPLPLMASGALPGRSVTGGPRLIGIMQQAGSRVALIETQDGIVYARSGDNVSGLGNVEAIGESGAVIGGKRLAVAALAVANVDQQNIKALAARAMNPGGGTGMLPPAMPGIPPASFGAH